MSQPGRDGRGRRSEPARTPASGSAGRGGGTRSGRPSSAGQPRATGARGSSAGSGQAKGADGGRSARSAVRLGRPVRLGRSIRAAPDHRRDGSTPRRAGGRRVAPLTLDGPPVPDGQVARVAPQVLEMLAEQLRAVQGDPGTRHRRARVRGAQQVALAGRALAGRALAGRALAGRALAGRALAGRETRPPLPTIETARAVGRPITRSGTIGTRRPTRSVGRRAGPRARGAVWIPRDGGGPGPVGRTG